MKLIIRIILFVLLFAGLAGSGFPAEKKGIFPKVAEAPSPAVPEDPLGRSTPQGTVFGFLKKAGQGDYEQAIQYLDTKKTGFNAQKIIYALRVILEYGSSGKAAMLSSKPEGNLDDNLPPTKERIGTVETPSGRLDIVLERIQRGNSPPIWLFSAETLKLVPETYEELDVFTIEAYLPKFLVDNWILWFPLWRWLAILLGIPLAFALATFLTRLIIRLLLLYSRRKFKVQDGQPVVRLAGPIRILNIRFGDMGCFPLFSVDPGQCLLDLCGCDPDCYGSHLAASAVDRYLLRPEREAVGGNSTG